MGLDMYFKKRIYVGANYEHRNVKGTIDITAEGKSIPIKLNRVSEIIEQIGYLRKANAIHNWIVENCQEGRDECQETYMGTEKVEKLLKICKEVQEDHSKAATLLPPTSGFFFGGTELDEWYFEQIDETVKILEDALTEDGDIYYRSSW